MFISPPAVYYKIYWLKFLVHGDNHVSKFKNKVFHFSNIMENIGCMKQRPISFVKKRKIFFMNEVFFSTKIRTTMFINSAAITIEEIEIKTY